MKLKSKYPEYVEIKEDGKALIKIISYLDCRYL